MRLSRAAHLLEPVTCLTLPFVVFFWMLPGSGNTTIGNDYSVFPVFLNYQIELFFSLKNGSFPLFVPGFFGGQSASALALGQIFHPLPHLASAIPGYWSGQTLEILTSLKLLSLGLTHWLLYRTFRALDVERAFSFVISLAGVYNLRMLDLFRYGSPLESYTAHLWLVCAAIHFYIRPSRVVGPLSIAGATYLLLTSGHQQMLYYGFIFSGLFALLTPFYVRSVAPERAAGRRDRDYFISLFVWITAGVLLSSAFLAPQYFDFIRENAPLTDRSFEWSLGERWRTRGLADILNAIFKPFHANVHSSFAGPGVFIPALFTPLLLRKRDFSRPVILALWVLIPLILAATVSDAVYRVFWQFIPLCSSFRVPGRLTMALPAALMMLFAWQARSSRLSRKSDEEKFKIAPYAVTAWWSLAALLAYQLYPQEHLARIIRYTPHRITLIPSWADGAALSLGALALLALACLGSFRKFRALWIALLLAATIAQTGVVMRYGTWVGPKPVIATADQISAEKGARLRFLGKAGYVGYDIGINPEVATRRPLATIVPDPAGSADPAASVHLVYSSNNRLRFETQSSAEGIFGLSLLYSPRWKAAVDGIPANITRWDGAYQAITLPPGYHTLDFRYDSPAARWGMAMSCFAVFGILFYVLTAVPNKRRRAVLILIAALFLLTFFSRWQASLYQGKDFGTNYTWKSGTV